MNGFNISGTCKQWGKALGLLTGLLAFTGAAEAQTLCVYDPMGAQGNYVSLYKDYQLAAKRWGVSFDLQPYTDDNQMNDAFKAGKCDMASMVGMRARAFNAFTGSVDSPGTIENYAELRDVMALMASPKLAKYMANDSYEIDGVLPIGAGYAVVNDRKINGLAAAAGKRAAYMSWDKTQTLITSDFHVTAVPSDLTNYGNKFNHGDVDIIVAPMSLYKPMELAHGIGDKGGIIHRPLFQFTMQLVAHKDKFPAEFGQKSREYMNSQVDHALGIIRNDEAQVDSRNWIYALRSDQLEWNSSMRTMLAHLEKEGIFDSRMLAILHRVRCKSNVTDDDCTSVEKVATSAPLDQLLAGIDTMPGPSAR
jgi:hypothetical protein